MKKFKFKQYPNEYEKIFSDEKRAKRKCNLEHVHPFMNNPSNTALYIKQFRETIKDFELKVFDSMVKMEWLKRRFCWKEFRKEVSYNNNHNAPSGGTRDSMSMNIAFGNFMRYYVGYDNRFYWNYQSPFVRILRYIDELFPNFDNGDPFKEKYEYPFSHVGLDCMGLVSDMPERIDLLKYADSKKMSYAEFVDYVINYVFCYNDEHGDVYLLILSSSYFPYVKVLKHDRKKEASGVRAGASRILSAKSICAKYNPQGNDGGGYKSKGTS